MTEVDVIMVAHTANEQLHQMTLDAIHSLLRSEPSIIWHITIVEDCGETQRESFSYRESDRIKVVYPEWEFNYNKHLCRGLQEGESQWVVMCNNDLKFHYQWFSRILEAHKLFDGTVESFGTWDEATHRRFFPDRKLFYVGYQTSYELTGWNIVCTRRLLEKINFCDPRNQRVEGWYSDNCYADCLKAHKEGHILVRQSRVDHDSTATMRTFPKERQMKLMQAQISKYKS